MINFTENREEPDFSPPSGTRIKELVSRLQVIRRLGLVNVTRVLNHRLRLRLHLHPVQRIVVSEPIQSPFFRPPPEAKKTDLPGNRQWQGQHTYFDWLTVPGRECPDWHQDPLTGQHHSQPDIPWWSIPDFSPGSGDIKSIWEASRFNWVLGFAQSVCQGDLQASCRLNYWLQNWITANPPYLGVNWKCGQEASIRVMHLAMAALILGQAQTPEPGLVALLTAHLRRIAATISYAVAQDNNHGTSEAAALFIGGSWLTTTAAGGGKEAGRWLDQGRGLLETRVARLIEPDGSFSQYSVNYHRLMLDTLSMVEVWRRTMAQPAFSSRFCRRLRRAAEWLYHFTEPVTGDAPNIGANDGARLLPLTDTGYRDYRPAVQLAMALFTESRAYPDQGAWNLPLQWLDIPLPRNLAPAPQSRQFDHGGYSLLRDRDRLAVLRYPRFRFRPGHADALHLDFWLGEENLLRDGGSFSYNAEPPLRRYFTGTASHNTIQFDDRNQMIQLGRFLFGNWLKTDGLEPVTIANQLQAAAGYTDRSGASHHRRVVLRQHALEVTDRIYGAYTKAVLRWRLKPGEWQLRNGSCSDGRIRITVNSDRGAAVSRLTAGSESRYYLSKQPLTVLETMVSQPDTITTVIEWPA